MKMPWASSSAFCTLCDSILTAGFVNHRWGRMLKWVVCLPFRSTARGKKKKRSSKEAVLFKALLLTACHAVCPGDALVVLFSPSTCSSVTANPQPASVALAALKSPGPACAAAGHIPITWPSGSWCSSNTKAMKAEGTCLKVENKSRRKKALWSPCKSGVGAKQPLISFLYHCSYVSGSRSSSTEQSSFPCLFLKAVWEGRLYFETT